MTIISFVAVKQEREVEELFMKNIDATASNHMKGINGRKQLANRIAVEYHSIRESEPSIEVEQSIEAILSTIRGHVLRFCGRTKISTLSITEKACLENQIRKIIRSRIKPYNL